MTEATIARFGFSNYRIKKFSYTESEDATRTLKIQFFPSGLYNVINGEFRLGLIFTGTEDKENGKLILEVVSEAIFKFEAGIPFTDIPDFFYKNSIAIFFPYLRAFVSTMTLQAHAPLILLDVMNLSNLEQPFKENTKEE